MRKWALLLFIIIGSFMFNIISVNASNGLKYNYDIEKITASGKNINITGWVALISGKSGRIHHLTPTHTLRVVNSSGKVLYSVGDKSKKSTKDYTQPYYYRHSGFPAYYPSKTGVNNVLKTSYGTKYYNNHPNFMYININFEFSLPISKLQELLKTEQELMLSLHVKQNPKTESIYGVSVRSDGFEYTIDRLGAQDVTLDDSVKELKMLKVEGATDSVTVIVSEGIVQGHAELGKCRFLCSTGSMVCNDNLDPKVTYRNGGTYKIKGKQSGLIKGTSISMNVYIVPWAQERSGSCTAISASKGKNSYMPTFWRNPLHGSNLKIVNICEDWGCKQEENKRLMCSASSISTTFSHPPRPGEIVIPPQADPDNLCPDTLKKCEDNFEEGILVKDNGLCKIKCNETMEVNFERYPTVRAGMGFAYPIAITGTRVCKAEYDNETWVSTMNSAVVSAYSNYNDWQWYTEDAARLDAKCGTKKTLTRSPDCPSGYSYRSSLDKCARDVCSNSGQLWSEAQAEIAAQKAKAASHKAAHDSAVSTINTLNSQRTYCDTGWRNKNRYSMNPSISANVADVYGTDYITYTKTSNRLSTSMSDELYKTYKVNQIQYYTTGTGAPRARTISPNSTYYTNWTETSNLDTGYEFTTVYYIHKYDGTLSTTGGSNYYYGGRKYFTDLRAPSGRYDFDVFIEYLGPNIPPGTTSKTWKVDMDCHYNLENKIMPPKPELYGPLAVVARQVSLVDPFPGRKARENWRGKEHLITSKGYSVYKNKPLYEVRLTPASMADVRRYNQLHIYGSFNLDAAERSHFIHYTFPGLFIRK